jgi:DNA invertase Pin-like site-specific DNA recombinase
MGRLTLNILLSFAQFGREVIGERIRHKVAASRRKGLWMVGTPPLGYDVRDRKLVANEKEAELVRSSRRSPPSRRSGISFFRRAGADRPAAGRAD